MIDLAMRGGMVPLRMSDPDWVRFAADAPHRSSAFRHATLHGRPGLWGDDAERPTSAVWLRESDRRWEAFGAGRDSPAVDWLASRSAGKPIALVAPPTWEAAARIRGGRVEVGTILCLSSPRRSLPRGRIVRVPVRRLARADVEAFRGIAPAWALRSWQDYESMIDRGAAVGVPMTGGFASLAWTLESDPDHDKIGVSTDPRYRDLGLGTAASTSLTRLIVEERQKMPLWVTTPENPASIAVALALGLTVRVEERLIRWTPAGPGRTT